MTVSRGRRVVYRQNTWTIGVQGYNTTENVGWAGMVYWIVFILLSALVVLSAIYWGGYYGYDRKHGRNENGAVHGKDD